MELPRVGDNFEGRYQLLQVLGKGGFATVFRARDHAMSRDVVVKVLTPDDDDASYPDTVSRRFAREARVFATLQDPHTITMYDFGTSASGLLFMVFEFVPGRDLQQLTRERGAFAPAVALHILTQMLMALQEAHALGVVHRDVKPANVIVFELAGDAHRVKLIDFGIAKVTNADATQLTHAGTTIGTLRYMAPEQFHGEESPSSDLFSAALVAAELVTGTPVFAGGREELVRALLDDAPIKLPGVRPGSFRAVLERMLAREPQDRFPSATAVLSALRVLRREVADFDPVAPVAEPVAAVAEPVAPSRSARPWRVGAVAALVVVVGLGAWFFRARDEPPIPPQRTAPVRNVERLTTPSVAPTNDVGPADAGMAPASDGCGRAPPFVGRGTMRAGAVGRAWQAYVPPSYDPQHRHPLVLMFHRSFRDASLMIEQTRITPVADREGFVVFAFESSEATRWPGDDIANVQDALDAAGRELCLDDARRFAIGDEAGARMVSELACTIPLAAVASAWNGNSWACDPVVPTPRIRLYGTRDKTQPAEGGWGCNPVMGTFGRAEDIERTWMRVNGCPEARRTRPWGDFEGGACHSHAGCDAALVVCATNAGHQWPGSNPAVELDACRVPPAEVEFPFAEAIWSFFEAHGRPPAQGAH